MPRRPVPADPGPQESRPGAELEPVWEPVITRPDPMTAEEQEAWLAGDDEPPDLEEEWDRDGEDELTADELAEIRRATADEMLAIEAATAGRRGPRQAGSARVFPGESSSPAAGFGPGLVLDVTPGCPGLALSADAAAGDEDAFDRASDAELIGMLCAWDRVEAHAAARKLAAVAELIRRRPEPDPATPAPSGLAVGARSAVRAGLAVRAGPTVATAAQRDLPAAPAGRRLRPGRPGPRGDRPGRAAGRPRAGPDRTRRHGVARLR